MAVNSTIVVAALAASLQQGLPPENTELQNTIPEYSEKVQCAVKDLCDARLGPLKQLSGLRYDVTGNVLTISNGKDKQGDSNETPLESTGIYASRGIDFSKGEKYTAADTGSKSDVVKLPPYIDDVGDDTFEWYSSLSLEDRNKVNNFYNGLIQLPSKPEKRDLAIGLIMSDYIRFIKAISSRPGELFGFAKSSLEFAIKTIKKGGFPEELATRLSQYLEMADKADKNFKLAKVELDEINARIAELIKKREKLNKDFERIKAEGERIKAEGERLDGLIRVLQKTKDLLSQKAV